MSAALQTFTHVSAQTFVFFSRILVSTGPKRDEVTGEWRKLRNEELRDLYSSSTIVWVIKSRIGWAGPVARMGRE
jgi:hypothetical protein